MGPFRRPFHSSALILLSSFLFLFSVNASAAAVTAHFASPKVKTGATGPSTKDATSPCPFYSGVLDSASVAVGGTTALFIELGGSLPYDITFTLYSGNLSILVFGNQVAGFAPTVTIPAGTLVSATFTIQGVTVGESYILAIPDPDIGELEVPVTTWNVSNTSGTKPQLLDAVDPISFAGHTCIGADGTISTDLTVLSTCGWPIDGVATDGASKLLLRAVAGFSGNVCFTLTTTGSLAYGNVDTSTEATNSAGSLQYATALYTPPDGYGDTSDSRTINIEFDYYSDDGMTTTSTINVTTTLVRPPVMLIHGVWSSDIIWDKSFVREVTFFGSKAAFYTTTKADYSGTAGAPFTTNQVLLQNFIREALGQMHTKGYASIMADVIGHSMGGNLTRLYSTLTTGPTIYQRPQNLNLGDVHRLITLDTPHFGSNFPNLILALNTTNPAETASTVSGVTGGQINQGAVCDLTENSKGLTALNGTTNLVGQVIVGEGGPPGTVAVPAKWWGGATVFGVKDFESALTAHTCFLLCPAFIFPQATVNAFRYREQNDSIVPLTSQLGGNLQVPANTFPDDLHQHIGHTGLQGGVTDDSNVAAQAFVLLDGPVSALLPSFPGVSSSGKGESLAPTPGLGVATDQANYASQCTATGAPLYPAAALSKPGITFAPPLFPLRPVTSPSSITVTSPTAGTVFGSSDVLSITVAVAAGVTVNGYGVLISGNGIYPGSGLSTGAGGSTFQANTTLTGVSVGPITITPYIYDGTNTYVQGIPVTVVEKYTGGTLTGVNLTSNNFLTLLPGATQALHLLGSYSDNSGTYDISSSLMGTTWTSSNPSVLTVDANGNVNIVAVGIAVVTAKNGAFTDFANFVVENPATPLAPIDYTPQFTIQQSGIRLNRGTGLFVQTVTLTNKSALPLAGPAYLLVSGLPTGVSLVGINGVTANIAPVGSDYFALPLGGYGLAVAPGQVVNLQFQFLNPGQVGISYALKVYRTSVAP